MVKNSIIIDFHFPHSCFYVYCQSFTEPGSPTSVECPAQPKDMSLDISWTAPTNPNGFIQYYLIAVYNEFNVFQRNVNTTEDVVKYTVQSLSPGEEINSCLEYTQSNMF